MKQVRVGLIGCGPRGVKVLRDAAMLPEVTITAVCDRYAALTQTACAAINGQNVRCFTDHQQMLREAKVDAVLVVVEPEVAAALCVDVLEAGRHVYSEVPLGFSLEDCWRLVVAVERTGLLYQLGEQARFWPFMRRWRQLVAEGSLGEIVHAEGQYLHGMQDDRYWMDGDTGARLTLEQAANHPHKVRSRIWNLTHPILYLPHELSPLLYVLDDEVVEVLGMSTGSPSRVHPWFPHPDLEVALMKTRRGAVLRLSAGFTVLQPRRQRIGCHWYNVMGTKGSVESPRADGDAMKLWLPEGRERAQPQVMEWDYDDTVPQAVRDSGHGGADYWPIRGFIDAILHDQPVELDVYRAAQTAAPAILAAQSIEQRSQLLPVPDFRPNGNRAKGQLPAQQDAP